MCIRVGSLTFPFPAQSMMHSWQKASLKNTAGPQFRLVTFHVRSEEDLRHALWLMRLSYLRYALKRVPDPRRLLRQEIEELRLSPHFKSLLEAFVPSTANNVANI